MMKRFDMGLSLAVCFATALDGVACAQDFAADGQERRTD